MSLPARAAAAAVALLLAAPAAVQAETFFVDPSGSGTECSEAAPCDTIAKALTASRGAAGTGDEIEVGTGLFSERVVINDEKDAGLTLRGAGRGPDQVETPSEATTIRPSEDNKNNVIEVKNAPGVTIESLRVEVPSGFVNTAGVQFQAPEATLRDAHAQSEGGQNTEAVYVTSGTPGASILGTRIRQMGDARGMTVFGPTTTIADSDLSTDGQQAVDIEGTLSADTRILRSRLQAAEGSVVTVLGGAEVAIDSSLVTGGSIGISLNVGFGSTGRVSLFNSTIDVADAKSGAQGTALEARAFEGSTAEMTMVDSIAVERQSVEGDALASVSCRSSIVQPQSEVVAAGSVECGSGAGNLSAPAVSVFVPGEDWHLQPGSPAVDSGEGEGLLSATDLDGLPRILDGDGDGAAVIDRGAYELPTPAPASGSPLPSNDFTFGRLKRNRRKGTARLEVRVPGPGSLVLSGKKMKRSALDAKAAGSYSLRLRPKRRLARSLRSKRRARVSVKVTFTPTGGTANSRSKSLTLIRRPRR